MRKIKVAIANENKAVSNKLSEILRSDPEINLMLRAENLQELINKSALGLPDVLLVSIGLPQLEKTCLWPSCQVSQKPKLIAMSRYEDPENIIAWYQKGAKSFICEDEMNETVRIIKIINNGGTYWTDSVNGIIQNKITRQNQIHHVPALTGFDVSLLRELSKGKSCTELGELFSKSPRTIEKYREQLYQKFGVVNKEQLISEASKCELI